MNKLMPLQIKYDLSLAMARILALLAENKVVTVQDIESEHRITKDAKVAIHRLRRRLAGTDITINHRRDVGYWLDKPTADTLARLMSDPDQFELPLGGGGNDSVAVVDAPSA